MKNATRLAALTGLGLALWLLVGASNLGAQSPPPKTSAPASESSGKANSADASPDRLLPTRVREALKHSASYLTNGNDIECRLVEFGYTHPGITEAHWNTLSPYAKVETAYLSAETAHKGGGGRFLALLSRSLAQEYESAARNPVLEEYLDRPYDSAKLRFAQFDSDRAYREAASRIPPEVRTAIRTLSAYAETGEFGAGTVLREYFQLKHEQVDEILRTSRTNIEVLERGYLMAPETRAEGMKKLVAHLDINYESARSVTEFNRWREEPARNSTRSNDYGDAFSKPVDLQMSEHSRRLLESQLLDSSRKPIRDPFAIERPRSSYQTESVPHESAHGASRRGVVETHGSRSGRAVAVLTLVNAFMDDPCTATAIILGVIFFGLLFRGKGSDPAPSTSPPVVLPDPAPESHAGPNPIAAEEKPPDQPKSEQSGGDSPANGPH